MVKKTDKVVIRALWGIFDKSHAILQRRFRIERNIASMLNNPLSPECIVYVYGKDNIETLKKVGCLNYRVVSEQPYAWDIVKHQYRHKLEIIKIAMEDGIKELLYMDWDCIPQKQVPFDFWESMSKRASFQANLEMYNRRKAFWRKIATRQVPNGGFIYLNDKKMVDKAIEFWEARPQDNDEPAWGQMLDWVEGGWKSPEFYWDKYEAMHCNLHNKCAFDPKLMNSKDVSFIHFHGKGK